MCPECIKNDAANDKIKMETLKPKFMAEAARAGFNSFAILRTKNDNPGFMWRQIDDPDCERLGVVEYCIVY